MKKVINLSKWWTYIKKKPFFKLLKIITKGILLGIITGLIVSSLFSTPSIILYSSTLKVIDDKYNIKLELKNVGHTKALKVECNLFAGIKGDPPDTFQLFHPQVIEFLYPDEVVISEWEATPEFIDNKHSILFLHVNFEDQNWLRQIVNQGILGHDYEIKKWYIFNGKSKSLSLETSVGKEKYEKELYKRMKEDKE